MTYSMEKTTDDNTFSDYVTVGNSQRSIGDDKCVLNFMDSRERTLARRGDFSNSVEQKQSKQQTKERLQSKLNTKKTETLPIVDPNEKALKKAFKKKEKRKRQKARANALASI